jgi:hypothetical protein
LMFSLPAEGRNLYCRSSFHLFKLFTLLSCVLLLTLVSPLGLV